MRPTARVSSSSQSSFSPPAPHYPRPPYRSLIQDLTQRYPVLNCLEIFFHETQKRPLHPIRAAVLEFKEDYVVRIDFIDGECETGYSKLRRYLEDQQRGQHCLFILEDLHPDFVELLGGHLNVDGTVFAHQIRDNHWSDDDYNDNPKLPSCCVPDDGYTLRYYEARFLDPYSGLPELSASMKTVGNIERVVTQGVRTLNDKGDPTFVGLVRRNTSFWSQKFDDGSWNGVLLVDPPISQDELICNFSFPVGHTNTKIQALQGYSNKYEWKKAHIKTKVFQGGYRDFAPWPKTSVKDSPRWGPKRESLLDDISYYWTAIASPAQITSAIKYPFNAATFQLQIVASIWQNTLSDVHAILSRGEISLWKLERMLPKHLSDESRDRYLADFTQELNTQNTLRRRLAWYVSEMETNLLSLGISPINPPPFPASHETDFLLLHHKLLTYQSWAEKLMDVINNHVNLIETEKTISDSKSLNRLTILGFLFVPVSIVASFFSMGGEFAVGQSRFWIFWVAAVVVVGVTCVVGFWKYWSIRWDNWREKGRR